VDPVFAVEQLSPQVDAVVGWLGNETGASQKALGSRPLVLLDLANAGAAGEVTFDYAHAARLALNHVLERGPKTVTYLDYVRDQGLSVRAQAFARQAGELGIPITFINAADSAPGARQVVASLLEMGNLPDVLITFNDVMAIGAIKAMAAAGKSAPNDCAVLGMDGISLGELLTPELTTLAIDFKEMGVAAVTLVEELLSGKVQPGSDEAKRILKHQLRVRQTG
jgi:DNA-binding LacI/PurR family transcriptional regulator